MMGYTWVEIETKENEKIKKTIECWNAYISMTAHIGTFADRRHIVAVSPLSEGRNSLKYDNISNISPLC